MPELTRCTPPNLEAPPLRPRHFACCVMLPLLLAASATGGAEGELAAPFTRITSGPIATSVAASISAGWGDFDNDGWLDLFVGNQDYIGMTNFLFHNQRDGTFRQVTESPVANTRAGSAHAAAWADYDNDGWLDLFVASLSNATNALYRNLGHGEFVRMAEPDVGPPARDSGSVAAAWADYDADGKLDLFVANGALMESRRDWLYRHEGDGRFVRVTNAISTPARQSTQGAWSDFDNDGDPDLLVAHHNEQGTSLFRNEGAGEFVEVGAASGLTHLGHSTGAAWGDYDNDGHPDLLITNLRRSGPDSRNFLYRNNGDGTFNRITVGAVAEDTGAFLSCGWVDYDNDGWLDLFLTVPSSGDPSPGSVKNRLYRNQGDGTFAKVTQGSVVTDGGDTGGAAWGDYDNDGFVDLFVCFGAFTSTTNALYHNDGNSNSWVKVRCVGTLSNRSAIGAKVRVKAKIGGADRWQMREIFGSQGWLSFNSLDVLVGLGDATVIETLRVEWPSGRVQEFRNLAVRQTLTIVEHSALRIAARGTGEFDLSISGPRQQRFRVETATELSVWSPVTSISITNPDRKASLTYPASGDKGPRFFRAAVE